MNRLTVDERRRANELRRVAATTRVPRVITLEHLEARFLRLVQCLGEDVGGKTVDLRVELQGGHEVRRARHLEVHVAERVLGAEDVGQGRVLAVRVHEAHGDAGDGALDRHAGVHQRERRAAD